MKAILGRKVGMTQVFTTEGEAVTVTVVEVLPNVVLQKKTIEKDGYEALQLGYEDQKESLTNKPQAGHFTKANSTPKKFVKEVKGDEMNKYNVGDSITVDLFQAGEAIDVTGVSKGKGFTGLVKMRNQSIGPKGHGSGYHRGVGSLATNGRCNNRIHPGRIMPSHYGNKTTTVLNLEIVSVDVERNALLIKGAIPGAKKGLVTVRSAIKAQKKAKSVKNLVDYSATAAQ